MVEALVLQSQLHVGSGDSWSGAYPLSHLPNPFSIIFLKLES